MLNQFIARFGKNKEKFSEMESDMKLQKILEQKQKTSNERELERRMEEKRQQDIKKQLDELRAEDRRQLMSGGLLSQPSVFARGSNILHQEKSVLANNNMFLNRGNLF